MQIGFLELKVVNCILNRVENTQKPRTLAYYIILFDI